MGIRPVDLGCDRRLENDRTCEEGSSSTRPVGANVRIAESCCVSFCGIRFEEGVVGLYSHVCKSEEGGDK